MVQMSLSREQSQLFEQLYRERRHDVFRTCLRFAAGDRAWALDRAQDVFVTLAENLHKLDEGEDLGGWLYRVAVNACLMALRKQRGWRRVVDQLTQVVGSSAPSAERSIRARRDLTGFERALGELKPKQRMVMSMLLMDGRSQTEIAKALGLSKGRVSQLVKAALEELGRREWEVRGE